MNFIGRVLTLPMLAVMVIAAVFLPLFPLALLTEPTAENVLVLLVLLGFWPMSLGFVHGAYIEHFIVRSVSARSESLIPLTSSSDYVDLVLWAGDHLERALEGEAGVVSAETVQRACHLIERHRRLARMVWPGFAVTFLGALGLYLLQR